jgi:hypothetical protein
MSNPPSELKVLPIFTKSFPDVGQDKTLPYTIAEEKRLCRDKKARQLFPCEGEAQKKTFFR